MFTIPVLNVKANALDALLAVIGLRFSMLAKSENPKIKSLLADRKVSIEFGSEADGIARYFVFDTGTFKQYVGNANDPTLRIDFKDSATGVKLLAGGDVTAFMSAIQNKDVSMEGDYSLLMWFGQLAKHIVPPIPEEIKPYIKQAQPYIKQVQPYANKAQEIAMQVVGMAKQKLFK